jgi:hypothetical protein
MGRAPTAFDGLAIPRIDGLLIVLERATVKLVGTIAGKAPSEALAAFFQAVHGAVLQDERAVLNLDVTELTYVSSSSIHLFVDLLTSVKGAGSPYQVRFRSRRSIAWQRTAFMALQSLTKGVLVVEYSA